MAVFELVGDVSTQCRQAIKVIEESAEVIVSRIRWRPKEVCKPGDSFANVACVAH
jgi:hypothetical protein